MVDTIIWAVLVGVFVAVEAATVALLSTWFIIGSVAALVTSLFTPSVPAQILVFVGVSLVSLVVLRPMAKERFFTTTQATNADRVIGEIGVVLEPVTGGAGLVKVSGADWSARSETGGEIAAGEEVRVLRIEGVKVIVQPRELKGE